MALTSLEVEDAARRLGLGPGCRIVAVLGYSTGQWEALHPVCAARVQHAAQAAGPADAVVLSGWAGRRKRQSEAELMRGAWPGPSDRLVCDRHARTTAENAALVAALARTVGAADVLVVTSRWHAARAGAFFRSLLRDSGVRVAVACPDEPRSARFWLGELWRWPLVPIQLARVRRRYP